MIANRSEPIPLLQGSTTASVIAVASAASTALPPRWSIAMPACVASGCEVATAFRARMGWRRLAYGSAQSQWRVAVEAAARVSRAGMLVGSAGFLERFAPRLAEGGGDDQEKKQSCHDEHGQRKWPGEENRRIPARQEHRPAKILLHHRPEHEAQEQRRGFALEFQEDDTEEAEGGSLAHVEMGIVD